MNWKQLVIVSLFLLKGSLANASEPFYFENNKLILNVEDSALAHIPLRNLEKANRLLQKTESPKIIALTLAITLGVFGVHRLYLGTHAKVPVFYALTFGGGLGVLTLTDIIAILATKDLAKYQDNDKVVMWLR